MKISNKKVAFYVINLFLVAIMVGCNQGKHRHNSNEKELIHFDISKWEKNKTFPDGLIKSIEFLPLETTDSCLIGSIDKLLIENDRIYVLDKKYNKKIFIFNIEGSFIKSIGKYGKGPGESLSTDDFVIDEKGNRLFVLDIIQRKVLVFDLTFGNYLQEFRLKFLPDNFTLLDENTFVFYTKYQRNINSDEFSIVFFDIKEKSCRWFLKKDEYDTRLSSLFSIYKSENIFYAPFLRDVIYKITEDNVVPSITFNFGDSKVPSEKLKTCINNPPNILNVMKEGKWTYGISNVLENNDHIVFNLVLRGSRIHVIYDKTASNYYYGNRFNGIFNIFGKMKKLTVYDNKFIGSIDASLFKKLNSGILEQNNVVLKDDYLNTFGMTSEDSNPIIVSIKYNNF